MPVRDSQPYGKAKEMMTNYLIFSRLGAICAPAENGRYLSYVDTYLIRIGASDIL
jgi:hypothetical protein